MHPNLVALAVPAFFAAIIAEAIADRVGRGRAYRLGSAISDLDTGIASQVADVFLKGLGLVAYAAVYRYRLVTFEDGSIWPWVIGIVGIDFLYYWWHRMSHTTNVLWAVHAVHHQSEDMNLAVALRQPAFEALTIIPFHLPLALLGVKPWIYVSCYAIDLIYQFWVHTEATRHKPRLEWAFNTPSAHRVHHGINPQYLDRNFGGIFLFWDRLFGTYEPELERPVYGVTHPLASYNPLWANFAPLIDVARLVRAAPPKGKLAAFFAHPARRPIGVALSQPSPAVDRATWIKYEPRFSRRVAAYVFAHFALLALAGGAFMSFADRASLAQLVAPGVILLVSTLVLGAWTEQRRWVLALDLARQVAAVTYLALYTPGTAGPFAAAGLALVMAAIFLAARPTAVGHRGLARLAEP
jgi:alkylglycerol monooxygenase